jgi:hypothetical protein
LASCTQIDHQIQSYLDGELAHSDRAIFELHLAECAGCAKLLRQHQRSNASLFEVYAPARLGRDLSEYIVSHLPEMEPAAIDVQRLNRRAKHPAPMREWLFRLMPLAAAALLLVLAGLIQMSWPDPAIPQDAVGVVAAVDGLVHRVASDTGARSRTRERVWIQPGDRIETSLDSLASVLALGPSEMRMAPNSMVTIDAERRITLTHGRIFLDVAPSQRYFKVSTPMGDVTVFGTRFEVFAEQDRTTVTVEEGKVQLSHHENPGLFRMVTADQRAYVEHALNNIPVESVDAKAECAWATSIEAGAAVREFFAKRVQPARETHEVSGEGGYIVPTNGKPLKSLLVTWTETSPFARYGDYDVFVYAPDNDAVFRARIPGSVFSDPRMQQIELPNTGDSTHGYPTVFVKIVAVNGPENGRVDFRSVSGRIGVEGR